MTPVVTLVTNKPSLLGVSELECAATKRSKSIELYGAPGEIRTPDPLVRSQILYPTELRAHILAEREGFEPSMGFCPILP